MLSALQFSGYRGFDDLRLENLGRVNLILGGNNTGKTSVLEALVLMFGDKQQMEKLPVTFRKLPGNGEDAVPHAFGVTLEKPGKEVDAGGVRFCGWVIPGNNRTGMLETLLLDAAREKEGACFPCLDDFMTCVEKTTRRALHEKARFLVWTLLAQRPGAQDRLSLKAALDQLPPDWNAKGFEPLVAVLKHAAGVG